MFSQAPNSEPARPRLATPAARNNSRGSEGSTWDSPKPSRVASRRRAACDGRRQRGCPRHRRRLPPRREPPESDWTTLAPFLLNAEKPVRRQSLSQVLRDHGHEPPNVESAIIASYKDKELRQAVQHYLARTGLGRIPRSRGSQGTLESAGNPARAAARNTGQVPAQPVASPASPCRDARNRPGPERAGSGIADLGPRSWRALPRSATPVPPPKSSSDMRTSSRP